MSKEENRRQEEQIYQPANKTEDLKTHTGVIPGTPAYRDKICDRRRIAHD